MNSLYILIGVGEMCEKKWDMSLGLSRQVVVKPMDLGFTGVNRKEA